MSTATEKVSLTAPFDTQSEADPNGNTPQAPELKPVHDTTTAPRSGVGNAADLKSALSRTLGGFFRPLVEVSDNSPRLLMIIGAPAIIGLCLILVFVGILGITAGSWGLTILLQPIGKKIVKLNLRILGSLISVTFFSVEIAAIAVALYLIVLSALKHITQSGIARQYIHPNLKISWEGVSKFSVKRD